MATSKQVKRWNGAAPLKRSLVPIDSLQPWPGNPRRGDVAAIMASLSRFGQMKPIIVQGARIVAGHHITLAAGELGWTHIAVLDHVFASEEEQRAFLLADNRTAELGSMDTELLVEQLRALADVDALAGTGYTDDDMDGYLAELQRLMNSPSPLDRQGKREHRDPDAKEVVLLYAADQLVQLEEWLKVVSREKGTPGTSETVFEGMRLAAFALNQGA